MLEARLVDREAMRPKVHNVERRTRDDLRTAVRKLIAAVCSGTLSRAEWDDANRKLESVLAEPGDLPYGGDVLNILREMRDIDEEILRVRENNSSIQR